MIDLQIGHLYFHTNLSLVMIKSDVGNLISVIGTICIGAPNGIFNLAIECLGVSGKIEVTN